MIIIILTLTYILAGLCCRSSTTLHVTVQDIEPALDKLSQPSRLPYSVQSPIAHPRALPLWTACITVLAGNPALHFRSSSTPPVVLSPSAFPRSLANNHAGRTHS
ncbi:uncharacterized protein LDX57_003989 [Aspergillus melleus]|uniref:uncharacterized protein n=1 Tax=Aspergillus melleus TaxID=138277 RepID=UPI001E8DBB08|nr:uncharacterized protein LDX57_003989 [Aspergillus melleus]KAH8426243.1 hypothetical protein LDX57_003989 [Aspergillus melleus]